MRGITWGMTAAILLAAVPVFGQASMVPEWLGRESEVLAGQREGTLPMTQGLYTAAPATQVESVPRALLLCHVSTSDVGPHGRWDSFADPDLRIVLHTGSFRGTAWGTENSMQAWVSFAGVALRPRQAIDVTLWDRDVTGDERMDVLRGTFTGSFPIELTHGTSSVSCALGDAAQAERETVALLAGVEPSVQTVEQAQVSLTAPSLGRPLRDDGDASARIATAMAWSGVREPRAVAMRDRLRAARTAFDRAVGAAVVTARRTPTEGPVTITGTTTSVTLAGTLPNARAIHAAYPELQPMACVIELTLSPASSDPATVLGLVDYVGRDGALSIASELVRSPTDPARVGVAFAFRVRDGVLRVGGNPRTLLVPR